MVRPKKTLGQHFLHDEKVAKRIIDNFSPAPGSFVVEIGFGTGVLTKHLLDFEKALFFDIDRESYEFITKKYPEYKEKFVLGDFLRYDLRLLNSHLSLIGNLPYNISSQIFFKIFDNKDIVSTGVFMVQKEVAQRLASVGGNKEYGILSVLLGAYFDLYYLFDVKKGSFTPPPKVTSAVIKLVRNDRQKLSVSDEFFKRLVKTVFGKRRKMLRNTLKELGVELKPCADKFLDLRPEQISVEEFIELAECLG